MEIAVADFPLFGMRTKMMVSVLVESSSPARSVASSSSRERIAVRVGAAVHADQQDVDRAVLAALAQRHRGNVVDAGFERADLAPRHAGADHDRQRRRHGDDTGEAGGHLPRLLAIRAQTG